MATYSDDSDVEAIFGSTSIDKWADLDGDGDATKITARKLLAREIAYDRINDVARNTHYTIPLQTAAGVTPTSVTNWEATLAGIWLYEASGVSDFDPRSGNPYHRLAYHRTEMRRTLKDFLEGRLKIDAIS
jgi:hypothetical protein